MDAGQRPYVKGQSTLENGGSCGLDIPSAPVASGVAGADDAAPCFEACVLALLEQLDVPKHNDVAVAADLAPFREPPLDGLLRRPAANASTPHMWPLSSRGPVRPYPLRTLDEQARTSIGAFLAPFVMAHSGPTARMTHTALNGGKLSVPFDEELLSYTAFLSGIARFIGQGHLPLYICDWPTRVIRCAFDLDIEGFAPLTNDAVELIALIMLSVMRRFFRNRPDVPPSQDSQDPLPFIPFVETKGIAFPANVVQLAAAAAAARDVVETTRGQLAVLEGVLVERERAAAVAASRHARAALAAAEAALDDARAAQASADATAAATAADLRAAEAAKATALPSLRAAAKGAVAERAKIARAATAALDRASKKCRAAAARVAEARSEAGAAAGGFELDPGAEPEAEPEAGSTWAAAAALTSPAAVAAAAAEAQAALAKHRDTLEERRAALERAEAAAAAAHAAATAARGPLEALRERLAASDPLDPLLAARLPKHEFLRVTVAANARKERSVVAQPGSTTAIALDERGKPRSCPICSKKRWGERNCVACKAPKRAVAVKCGACGALCGEGGLESCGRCVRLYKCGLHVVWPHVQVGLQEWLDVREAMVVELERCLGPRPSWNSWRAVVDINVPYSGLRMMFSSKAEKCSESGCVGRIPPSQRYTEPHMQNADLEGTAGTRKLREGVCTVCQGYGLVDTGRPYLPLFALRGDGTRHARAEAAYCTDLFDVLRDTQIRTSLTASPAVALGYALYEDAPRFFSGADASAQRNRTRDAELVGADGQPLEAPRAHRDGGLDPEVSLAAQSPQGVALQHFIRTYMGGRRTVPAAAPVQGSASFFSGPRGVGSGDATGPYARVYITHMTRQLRSIRVKVSGNGATWCGGKNDNHTTSNAWFSVTPDGAVQRCYLCRDYVSPRVALPTALRRLLFPEVAASDDLARGVKGPEDAYSCATSTASLSAMAVLRRSGGGGAVGMDAFAAAAASFVPPRASELERFALPSRARAAAAASAVLVPRPAASPTTSHSSTHTSFEHPEGRGHVSGSEDERDSPSDTNARAPWSTQRRQQQQQQQQQQQKQQQHPVALPPRLIRGKARQAHRPSSTSLPIIDISDSSDGSNGEGSSKSSARSVHSVCSVPSVLFDRPSSDEDRHDIEALEEAAKASRRSSCCSSSSSSSSSCGSNDSTRLPWAVLRERAVAASVHSKRTPQRSYPTEAEAKEHRNKYMANLARSIDILSVHAFDDSLLPLLNPMLSEAFVNKTREANLLKFGGGLQRAMAEIEKRKNARAVFAAHQRSADLSGVLNPAVADTLSQMGFGALQDHDDEDLLGASGMSHGDAAVGSVSGASGHKAQLLRGASQPQHVSPSRKRRHDLRRLKRNIRWGRTMKFMDALQQSCSASTATLEDFKSAIVESALDVLFCVEQRAATHVATLNRRADDADGGAQVQASQATKDTQDVQDVQEGEDAGPIVYAASDEAVAELEAYVSEQLACVQSIWWGAVDDSAAAGARAGQHGRKAARLGGM
jgi:hypothetical protein